MSWVADIFIVDKYEVGRSESIVTFRARQFVCVPSFDIGITAILTSFKGGYVIGMVWSLGGCVAHQVVVKC